MNGMINRRRRLATVLRLSAFMLLVVGLLSSGHPAIADFSLLAPRLRMELSKRGYEPDSLTPQPGGVKPLAAAGAVSVLVHLAPGRTGEFLQWAQSTGGLVNFSTNITAAVELSPSLIASLTEQPFVTYIAFPVRVEPKLDLSVPDIKADDVHAAATGSGLARAYTGKGVIIGVIDTGIDWSHGDFVNADGTSRILYLWDQTDNRGPSPGTPFTYGTEYNRDKITGALNGNGTVYEKDTHGHGTHVAGIAASNGRAPGGFTGVAPEADLIIVKTPFWIDDIETGIDYITTRAGQLGKPCVINMSLGTHYGPHDGSSHFCQTLDEFSGGGAVMVVSAGNEGNEDNHVGYTVSATPRDTPFYFEYGTRDGYVDIWYDLPGEIDFRVQAFDLIGLEMADTGWVAPGASNSVTIEDLLWTYGTLQLDATETDNPLNGSRHVVINAVSSGRKKIDEGSVRFVLHSRGNGPFDAWIDGGIFYPSADGEAYSGNSEKSVGMPGTAARAITVANYISKNSWTDLNGNSRSHWESVGPLTISSSTGPSRREDLTGLKPEIAAPGTYIAAALSVQASASSSKTTPDGEHWLIHGTSMAAPHVTGTIALMLEADPTLAPEVIETYLAGHTRRDDFVGDTVPNYSWGYGKLDTLAVMQALAGDDQPPVDPPEEIPEIDIRGNNRSIVSGDMTPETADHTGFGNVYVGGTALARTFTVHNTGSGELTLTGTPLVEISGPHAGDFSVALEPDTPVPAGDATTFRISFEPATATLRQAVVSLASDDSDENSFTFAIQGTGVQQTYSIAGDIVMGDGTPLPGVTVTIREDTAGVSAEVSIHSVQVQTGDVVTDNDGHYAASGFADGTYRVTPSLEGFVFDPASTDVTVSGADAVRNFTGYGLPEASAGAAPLSGTVPFTVTFTGSGTDPENSLANYEWDFDGSGTWDWESAAGGNTTHSYTRPGTYAPRFRVTDTDAYTDTTGVTIEAEPSQPPAARLSAEPGTGTAPLEVELTGTGTDPDGTITGYNWDFDGDGWYDLRSAATRRVTHVYRVPGIYQPTLQVTDNAGLEDTASVTIAVDPAPVNPEVTLSTDLDPAEGMAPLAVEFTVGTSGFPGTISSLEWDFDGDGAVDRITRSGEEVTYTYSRVGLFTARVTVTDSTGVSASGMLNIEVTPNDQLSPPEITIDIDYLTGTVPYEAHLSALISDADGVVESVTWDVDGDGQTDLTSDVNSGGLQVIATAVYTYHQPGSYRVRVTAIDDNGLTRTGLIEVFVMAPDALSVWITHPPPGRVVSGTAVTLTASTSPEDDTASVNFQYREDGASEWTDIEFQADEEAPFTASWNTSTLAPGDFELRARAEENGGTVSWSDAVPVTVNHDTPESREDSPGDGTITRQEAVAPDNNADLVLSDGTAVFIPYGTLDSATSIIVGVLGDQPPATVPDVSGADLARGGVYREFTLQSGQRSFTRAVTLTFPYNDENDDGIVDGTDMDENDLAVFWYDVDAAPPAWTAEQSVLVFPDDNYVEARVNHFSIFTLVETPEPAEEGPGGSVSSSGGGGGCFIATAAYVSYLEDDVLVLRRFRDDYMLPNTAGRKLVELYYATSPPLADIIADNESLRCTTRNILTPIVRLIELINTPSLPSPSRGRVTGTTDR